MNGQAGETGGCGQKNGQSESVKASPRGSVVEGIRGAGLYEFRKMKEANYLVICAIVGLLLMLAFGLFFKIR